MPTRGIIASGGTPVTGGITYCSVTDMVPEVRAILDDKPYQDVLGNSPGSGDSTITLNHAASGVSSAWVQGNVGEFDDGSGEQFLVLADPTSTTVSISRGYHSTTATSHSANIGVLKGFTYSYDQISRAIAAEVKNVWPYAWSTVTQSLTPSATTLMYALNGDFIDLIRVTQKTVGTISDIADLTRWARVEREVESATWTNAMALHLGWTDNLTNSVIVTYRAKLTTSTVECGLMSDCIVLGAANRLVRMKAVPAVGATDTQSDDNAQRQGARTAIGRDIYFDYLGVRSRVRAELQSRHRPARVHVR